MSVPSGERPFVGPGTPQLKLVQIYAPIPQGGADDEANNRREQPQSYGHDRSLCLRIRGHRQAGLVGQVQEVVETAIGIFIRSLTTRTGCIVPVRLSNREPTSVIFRGILEGRWISRALLLTHWSGMRMLENSAG